MIVKGFSNEVDHFYFDENLLKSKNYLSLNFIRVKKWDIFNIFTEDDKNIYIGVIDLGFT